MQEFKNIDSVEVHNSEKQNFRKIQPKEGMTLEVANAFWDKEIANVNFHNKITDVYTDDNGKEYRHGDSLLPNNEYVYSTNLQSCGCRLAIFVNKQNNKI